MPDISLHRAWSKYTLEDKKVASSGTVNLNKYGKSPQMWADPDKQKARWTGFLMGDT